MTTNMEFHGSAAVIDVDRFLPRSAAVLKELDTCLDCAGPGAIAGYWLCPTCLDTVIDWVIEPA